MDVEAPIDWTPKARQILGTASRLFYDSGITAVGVDRIAAESGVTKRTLYDRFGSKERLVVEYLRARDADWRDQLRQRLAAVPDDPRAQLKAVFDASDEWMRAHSAKGCSMIRAHAELPPDHPGYAVTIEQKRWMREMFHTLAEQAGTPHPGTVADTISLLHEGALVCYGMQITPNPITHARDVALSLLDRRG
ncbi:TetR/AcrR family transcriptional regulator [Nocardia mexicana]|uniref:TetR family transcriptional regulator n=1 Tax=Nocardia mexicana TaxID=279262 RepID=A0A370HBH3_9NOCA|nr:TetR/AcrR family transcriptional regulator [Nocardia mexicana]RDI54130.1 TetR family transcriptional regulator [Nocardia mexicana]